MPAGVMRAIPQEECRHVIWSIDSLMIVSRVYLKRGIAFVQKVSIDFIRIGCGTKPL